MAAVQQNPVLNALVLLSEKRELTPEQEQALRERGLEMVASENIQYVVIDRDRASERLRALAIEVFQLQRLDGEGPFDLYRPARPGQ